MQQPVPVSKRDEAQVLGELRRSVERAAVQLSDGSAWTPVLGVLASELADGQPFFFKVARASSSRSSSDVPVVSS